MHFLTNSVTLLPWILMLLQWSGQVTKAHGSMFQWLAKDVLLIFNLSDYLCHLRGWRKDSFSRPGLFSSKNDTFVYDGWEWVCMQGRREGTEMWDLYSFTLNLTVNNLYSLTGSSHSFAMHQNYVIAWNFYWSGYELTYVGHGLNLGSLMVGFHRH